MSEIASKLGAAIRRMRSSQGLSQEALAALAGINRTYLGEIERGEVEVSAQNLQRIAKGLGIRLSELILAYENEHD